MLALLWMVSVACGDDRPEVSDPIAQERTADTSAPREIEPGGHAVYVPAYSHIDHHRDDAYLLTVTLSIRNTDIRNPLTITSIRYYDTIGSLVRSYVREPRTLGPLESMEVVIEEKDVAGGSGANFLVEWRSDAEVNPPVIEAVMISTSWGQGISFTSRGVPIEAPTATARPEE